MEQPLKEAVSYIAGVPNYRAGYEADNGGDDGGGVKECQQCGGEEELATEIPACEVVR